MRQLGHVQFILAATPTPNYSLRTVAGRGYEVKWTWTTIGPAYWDSWHNHVIQPNNRGPISTYPWECYSEYMEWYVRHSHIRLINREQFPLHFSMETLPSYASINNVIDETSQLLERGLQLGENNIPEEARSSFEEAYNLSRCKYSGGGYRHN